jgi:hypothetical protein
MASIILSFVGQQDPFAKTETEGSIVTLVRYLVATQHRLKRVFLLHTDGTRQNAIDTCHWLVSEVPTLTPDTIEISPVSVAFSEDPVNPVLAIQEARKVLHQANVYQDREDCLELNASSGTPAMKTAWSVLQALGYASAHSHVWQIRNPKEMRPGQSQVFYSDFNLLKDELDFQVAKQQIHDYNYSGALVTLGENHFSSSAIRALLKYGYYRISMDFDRAFSCLNGVAEIEPQWIQEVSLLRQKHPQALLQEVYFNALIRLKNKKYADFLVGLFNLQEGVLYFLVQNQLGSAVSGSPLQKEESWQIIRQAEQGKLYRFLQNYRLPRGDQLDLGRSISRYTLQAIIEYYPELNAILPLIQELNQYSDLRNDSVHGFVGVSEIKHEAKLLSTLRKLMKQVTGISDTNPFDRLNQTICDLIDRSHRF